MTKIAIHCQFHEEITPSCIIDTTSKTFHCIGCSRMGRFSIVCEDESPWVFSEEEIINAEKETAEYGECYNCPECGYKTYLDRGKRFQCQLCGREEEYCGETIEEWHKRIVCSLNNNMIPF